MDILFFLLGFIALLLCSVIVTVSAFPPVRQKKNDDLVREIERRNEEAKKRNKM